MQKYNNPLLYGVFYRLMVLSVVLTALWTGVYWAL